MRHIIHKPEQMFYFFDRGEKFMAPFKKLWLTNRTPLGKISIDKSKTVWDMIGDIMEVDMETNPPLQAADMLAWSLNRELSDRTRLADLANRIRAFVSHEDDARIDEHHLRDRYIISSPASV
jgi:hypothetical protein